MTSAFQLFRLPAAALCTVFLSPVAFAQAAPASRHDRDAAETAYLVGARALRSGDFPVAETSFAQAEALNPARAEYLQALLLSREHHLTELVHEAANLRKSDPAAADRKLAEAHTLDPANPVVEQHQPQAATRVPLRTERFAQSIVLLHNSSTHSYHERTDIRGLVEHMARDFGVRTVLDPDLHTQTYRIDVDDVNFDDAMRVLNLLTGTMFVPLDENTIVVAQDTSANRQRYERLVEQTYYLPGIPADQLKDYVTIAQTVLNIQKVSVDTAQNAIVVRGPADLADAAQRIFADLLSGNNEVVFDVKVYAVDHSHTLNAGVILPSSFTAYNVAAEAASIVNANSSLVQQLISSGILPAGSTNAEIAAYLVFVGGISSSSNLANTFFVFGGGSTQTGVTTSNAPSINLALNNSNARTLDDVQVRAGDRQDAIFKTGIRYPIQTSLYSDIASTASNTMINGVSLSSLLSQYLGTSSLGSGAVIPQIQYEDIGLSVKATPRIQRSDDVSLKLEIKITALAGTALNGIPVLASRQFSSDLTAHDGDTVMMISDTSKSEIAAVTGIPGLSEIPGFQSTTNRNGTETDSSLVLLVTPHIVRRTHLSTTGPYIVLKPRPDND